MRQMTREEIIAALERAAFLLELKGENPFKIRAYQSAIRVIATVQGDPARLFAEGALQDLPGIGAAMAGKIGSLIETGRIPQLEQLEKEFPPTIFELLEIEGLGPKKIKALYDGLGIASVADLEAACADGRVAGLAGFGARSATKILAAINRRHLNEGLFLPYLVEEEVDYTLNMLRGLSACGQIAVAGSYRRGCELLRNLDFVASSKSPETLIEGFLGLPIVTEMISRDERRCAGRFQSGIPARLDVVPSAEFPFALAWLTGSNTHFDQLASLAEGRGWRLGRSGIETKEGADPPPPIKEEADLYEALGLPLIPPELREGGDEIHIAQKEALPRLIEVPNLRGTFHVHTTASDGRGSLTEMAEMAMALGLQYLGISDHSKSSFQANGLDERRLLEQVAQIREFNKSVSDFRLFAGLECDILKDGSLDFPDEILSHLDFVVVSVHSSFNLDRTKMTDRIIRAISNPHATILGHISGRLLARRDPYDLDIPAVLDAAAQTGTVIELNCNPHRMELDWRWWRQAKEKGVLCSINTDAHMVEGLGALWGGVRTARKGWLTRENVINCLPLGRIESALAEKRRRAGLPSLDGRGIPES